MEQPSGMQFRSLEPFVPSGADYESSRQLFQALGFTINWEMDSYTGFERDGCKFILQKFNEPAFAQNFMLSVRVNSVNTFRNNVIEKKLVEKFGIRMSKIISQPYGQEVNIIDMAGVCWHFVE